MSKKEFVFLIEECLLSLDRITSKLNLSGSISSSKYSRQQLTVLCRLHIGGKAKLKDIAFREYVTTPNLCATFRKLESENLVSRYVDENDRRNTWYCVTELGSRFARYVINKTRIRIENLFSSLDKKDEKSLTDSLILIRDVLKKTENLNV